MTKLNDQDKARIRKLRYKEQLTQKEIADRFGVSQSTIADVLRKAV